jgi:hypothetical protein
MVSFSQERHVRGAPETTSVLIVAATADASAPRFAW